MKGDTFFAQLLLGPFGAIEVDCDAIRHIAAHLDEGRGKVDVFANRGGTCK